MVEIVLGLALLSVVAVALVSAVIIGGLTFVVIREWVKYRRGEE